MRKIFVFIICLASMQLANAQSNIINQVQNAISGTTNLSNDEIIKGLKEALKVGTNNSTALASKLDGYYKNPKIKIPFPKEAQNMEKQLRALGMDKEVTKFVKTLNRAAEDAAKSAAPVFVDAITKITITDGLNILRGNNDAATQFLKKGSMDGLKAAFKPIVKSSLNKVELTKYWKPLTKTYNQIPLVKKMNPDLEEYVTLKAIEGLFTLIAEEELKIRKDPAARINDILKKVFGK